MIYKLSNGGEVNLTNNIETVKFLLFAYPKLGVQFVGATPHMILTQECKKFLAIRAKLLDNKKERRLRAKEALERKLRGEEPFVITDGWDDDIPF